MYNEWNLLNISHKIVQVKSADRADPFVTVQNFLSPSFSPLALCQNENHGIHGLLAQLASG